MMYLDSSAEEQRLAKLPRIVFVSTAALLAAGVAAGAAWSITGDQVWLRSFFSYPGALFFICCSALQVWLSFRCWRQFSSGDLLRPAWLLIAISAAAQLAGGLLNQIFGLDSRLNPLTLLPASRAHALISASGRLGQLFGPFYMAFLAGGLLYVLKACRRNGILGRLQTIDLALLGCVVIYTANYFATVVFAPEHGGRPVAPATIISWASDPLLCVLLFQAILIRRSAANMGLGLISRCWLSFTVAIFLTSVGDIGLWAWSRGYLPQVLVLASWYVWFLPSAAFALGPAYQLLAILRATRGEIRLESDAQHALR